MKGHSWQLLLVLVSTLALAAAGCGGDTTTSPEYGSLLNDPAFAGRSPQVAPAPGGLTPATPVLRGNQGPSVPVRGKSGQQNFHIVRGPTGSQNWTGNHISGGTNPSRYRDVVTGQKWEHIGSGADASLYKPEGTEHLSSGANKTLYGNQ